MKVLARVLALFLWFTGTIILGSVGVVLVDFPGSVYDDQAILVIGLCALVGVMLWVLAVGVVKTNF